MREADHSAPVVAHMDWSARNVRIGPQGLVAAYDWDSLALVPESTAVGQAAATWSVTSEPGGSEFPSLESITEFVLRYEEAAGTQVRRGAVARHRARPRHMCWPTRLAVRIRSRPPAWLVRTSGAGATGWPMPAKAFSVFARP